MLEEQSLYKVIWWSCLPLVFWIVTKQLLIPDRIHQCQSRVFVSLTGTEALLTSLKRLHPVFYSRSDFGSSTPSWNGSSKESNFLCMLWSSSSLAIVCSSFCFSPLFYIVVNKILSLSDTLSAFQLGSTPRLAMLQRT